MTTAARRHRLAMLYRLVPQLEVILCRYGEDASTNAKNLATFEEAKGVVADYVGTFATFENLSHLCENTQAFVRAPESYQAVAHELATILGIVVRSPRDTTPPSSSPSA